MTPSLIPAPDQTVYLVVDGFGDHAVFRETPVTTSDFETVIQDLMAGQYNDPVCVIALNHIHQWSDDASPAAAAEIKRRCDRADEDVPAYLESFVRFYLVAQRQA